MNTGRRALWLRSARIISGLLMLAFVTCHLLNAGLGVISVKAMDAARPFMTGPWTGSILGPVLIAALLVHFVLGLWAIYRRPTLRTSPQDLVQIFTSVCIVPLAAVHVVGIFTLKQVGVEVTYASTVRSMWIGQPWIGLLQVLLLTVIWIHGCAGLITWMRSMERARHVLPWVYPIAVAIPIAALLGYSEAGRRVLAERAAVQQSTAAYGQSSNAANAYDAPRSGLPDASPKPLYDNSTGYGGTGYGAAPSSAGSAYGTAPSAQEPGAPAYGSTAKAYGSGDTATAAPVQQPDGNAVLKVMQQVIFGAIALAVFTFFARAVRLLLLPDQQMQISFNDKTLLPAQTGPSVLDACHLQNVPHASLCEGRGRCATCAVRVIFSEYPLKEPDALERRTLQSRQLPDDARLACQIFPDGGRIEVEALYPPDFSFHDADDADDADDEADAAITAPVQVQA